MQILQLDNIARQRFNTVLSTQKVQFDFYYLDDECGNSSDGWYCNASLITSSIEIIALGYKMNSNIKLFSGISNSLIGGIYVVPISSPRQDLTSSTPWGITHSLIYLSDDEISEFGL